ncbi:MAG: 3-dehydroquinate synthase [candidate division KSB1 bacterium]|nr:3-dehydroquinate synthase [candidate division KSB1 bacterium]
MGRTVEVNLGPRSYRIYIGAGLLGQLGDLLAEKVRARRVFVITDHTVRDLYADQLVSSLQRAGLDPHVLSLQPGEGTKSLRVVAWLYDRFADFRVRRDETILALGGGVVGDVAGFAAATWLRGVPFVQVPTTVLSQVDSSVGGKVGINHASGKNLIGSFYQPILVVIDPLTLGTLPPAELWSGLAEVIKYGFVADRNLYDRIALRLRDLAAAPGSPPWEDLLARCCEIKAAIVQADERDLELRHVLNFGHTLGHALEAATGYSRFRHGEAVARGMLAALWLSHWVMGLPEGEFRSGVEALGQFPVPDLAGLSPTAVVAHIAHDKKGTSAGQKWVLLEHLGKATIVLNPDDHLVLRAAEKMLEV